MNQSLCHTLPNYAVHRLQRTVIRHDISHIPSALNVCSYIGQESCKISRGWHAYLDWLKFLMCSFWPNLLLKRHINLRPPITFSGNLWILFTRNSTGGTCPAFGPWEIRCSSVFSCIVPKALFSFMFQSQFACSARHWLALIVTHLELQVDQITLGQALCGLPPSNWLEMCFPRIFSIPNI